MDTRYLIPVLVPKNLAWLFGFQFLALFEKYVIDHFSRVIHRGVRARRDFSPGPPRSRWAARRAKSRSARSTLWITPRLPILTYFAKADS